MTTGAPALLPAVPRTGNRMIRTLADLTPLTSRGVLPSLSARDDIQLALPSASDDENVAWQRRLLRHARACGCEAGALSLVVALPAIVVARQVYGVHLVANLRWDIVAWIGVGVATSLFAKLSAIFVARVALRRLHAEIASRLARSAQ